MSVVVEQHPPHGCATKCYGEYDNGHEYAFDHPSSAIPVQWMWLVWARPLVLRKTTRLEPIKAMIGNVVPTIESSRSILGRDKRLDPFVRLRPFTSMPNLLALLGQASTSRDNGCRSLRRASQSSLRRSCLRREAQESTALRRQLTFSDDGSARRHS